jgi:type IV pilus assembly protein PilW
MEWYLAMMEPPKVEHCNQEQAMFRNQKGFTLVELLVVLALSSIVTAAVYKSFTAQQQVYIVQDQVAGMQQDIRASLEVMMKEIRMAGYDPQGTADAGITAATSSSIQFTADQNGNGVLVSPGPPAANDPNEDITYSLKPESDPDNDGVATVFPSELRRASWGVPQPLAEEVEVLNFVYLREQPNLVVRPISEALMPVPVSGPDLDEIRSIQVLIVLRTDRLDKNFNNTTTYTNLLYDMQAAEGIADGAKDSQALKWTAPNDGYRRRVVKTTIKCRNSGI